MHGGMDVLDRPSERFQNQAEDYIKRAETNPGDRGFWLALALECLRYATRARDIGR
jgi:hypothetical protein